jgi:3-dehydroquinate synthase
MSTATVRVELGARGYDVVIGPDAFTRMRDLLADRRRIALVTQTDVDALLGKTVRTALTDAGAQVNTFLMGNGEEAKTLATVERLCREIAAWGLLRGDTIVALGGGIVGDTAGYVAASYYRGVDVVQIPTTLLAMVDSAIGGKTGVNLPEGKNLVGAFHQPIGVFADPAVLASLPDREFRCGLGEVAKYAVMDDDPELGAIVRDRSAQLVARDPGTLADVIARSAAIKARVVATDEFERTGVRAILNLGHTVAHGLETGGGYGLLHGEAVAVGLVFDLELAAALERIAPAAAESGRALVGALGLPTAAPTGLRADDLLAIMVRDKKSSGGLTFVLPGPNGIERVDDPDPAAVRKAFAAIGVES